MQNAATDTHGTVRTCVRFEYGQLYPLDDWLHTSTRALRYVRLKDFYIFILLNVNTEWVVGIEVRDSDWCQTANALNVILSLSPSLSS